MSGCEHRTAVGAPSRPPFEWRGPIDTISERFAKYQKFTYWSSDSESDLDASETSSGTYIGQLPAEEASKELDVASSSATSNRQPTSTDHLPSVASSVQGDAWSTLSSPTRNCEPPDAAPRRADMFLNPIAMAEQLRKERETHGGDAANALDSPRQSSESVRLSSRQWCSGLLGDGGWTPQRPSPPAAEGPPDTPLLWIQNPLATNRELRSAVPATGPYMLQTLRSARAAGLCNLPSAAASPASHRSGPSPASSHQPTPQHGAQAFGSPARSPLALSAAAMAMSRLRPSAGTPPADARTPPSLQGSVPCTAVLPRRSGEAAGDAPWHVSPVGAELLLPPRFLAGAAPADLHALSSPPAPQPDAVARMPQMPVQATPPPDERAHRELPPSRDATLAAEAPPPSPPIFAPQSGAPATPSLANERAAGSAPDRRTAVNDSTDGAAGGSPAGSDATYPIPVPVSPAPSRSAQSAQLQGAPFAERLSATAALGLPPLGDHRENAEPQAARLSAPTAQRAGRRETETPRLFSAAATPSAGALMALLDSAAATQPPATARPPPRSRLPVTRGGHAMTPAAAALIDLLGSASFADAPLLSTTHAAAAGSQASPPRSFVRKAPVYELPTPAGGALFDLPRSSAPLDAASPLKPSGGAVSPRFDAEDADSGRAGSYFGNGPPATPFVEFSARDLLDPASAAPLPAAALDAAELAAAGSVEPGAAQLPASAGAGTPRQSAGVQPRALSAALLDERSPVQPAVQEASVDEPGAGTPSAERAAPRSPAQGVPRAASSAAQQLRFDAADAFDSPGEARRSESPVFDASFASEMERFLPAMLFPGPPSPQREGSSAAEGAAPDAAQSLPAAPLCRSPPRNASADAAAAAITPIVCASPAQKPATSSGGRRRALRDAASSSPLRRGITTLPKPPSDVASRRDDDLPTELQGPRDSINWLVMRSMTDVILSDGAVAGVVDAASPESKDVLQPVADGTPELWGGWVPPWAVQPSETPSQQAARADERTQPESDALFSPAESEGQENRPHVSNAAPVSPPDAPSASPPLKQQQSPAVVASAPLVSSAPEPVALGPSETVEQLVTKPGGATVLADGTASELPRVAAPQAAALPPSAVPRPSKLPSKLPRALLVKPPASAGGASSPHSQPSTPTAASRLPAPSSRARQPGTPAVASSCLVSAPAADVQPADPPSDACSDQAASLPLRHAHGKDDAQLASALPAPPGRLPPVSAGIVSSTSAADAPASTHPGCVAADAVCGSDATESLASETPTASSTATAHAPSELHGDSAVAVCEVTAAQAPTDQSAALAASLELAALQSPLDLAAIPDSDCFVWPAYSPPVELPAAPGALPAGISPLAAVPSATPASLPGSPAGGAQLHDAPQPSEDAALGSQTLEGESAAEAAGGVGSPAFALGDEAWAAPLLQGEPSWDWLPSETPALRAPVWQGFTGCASNCPATMQAAAAAADAFVESFLPAVSVHDRVAQLEAELRGDAEPLDAGDPTTPPGQHHVDFLAASRHSRSAAARPPSHHARRTPLHILSPVEPVSQPDGAAAAWVALDAAAGRVQSPAVPFATSLKLPRTPLERPSRGTAAAEPPTLRPSSLHVSASLGAALSAATPAHAGHRVHPLLERLSTPAGERRDGGSGKHFARLSPSLRAAKRRRYATRPDGTEAGLTLTAAARLALWVAVFVAALLAALLMNAAVVCGEWARCAWRRRDELRAAVRRVDAKTRASVAAAFAVALVVTLLGSLLGAPAPLAPQPSQLLNEPVHRFEASASTLPSTARPRGPPPPRMACCQRGPSETQLLADCATPGSCSPFLPLLQPHRTRVGVRHVRLAASDPPAPRPARFHAETAPSAGNTVRAGVMAAAPSGKVAAAVDVGGAAGAAFSAQENAAMHTRTPAADDEIGQPAAVQTPEPFAAEERSSAPPAVVSSAPELPQQLPLALPPATAGGDAPADLAAEPATAGAGLSPTAASSAPGASSAPAAAAPADDVPALSGVAHGSDVDSVATVPQAPHPSIEEGSSSLRSDKAPAVVQPAAEATLRPRQGGAASAGSDLREHDRITAIHGSPTAAAPEVAAETELQSRGGGPAGGEQTANALALEPTVDDELFAKQAAARVQAWLDGSREARRPRWMWRLQCAAAAIALAAALVAGAPAGVWVGLARSGVVRDALDRIARLRDAVAGAAVDLQTELLRRVRQSAQAALGLSAAPLGADSAVDGSVGTPARVNDAFLYVAAALQGGLARARLNVVAALTRRPAPTSSFATPLRGYPTLREDSDAGHSGERDAGASSRAPFHRSGRLFASSAQMQHSGRFGVPDDESDFEGAVTSQRETHRSVRDHSATRTRSQAERSPVRNAPWRAAAAETSGWMRLRPSPLGLHDAPQ